MDDSSVFRRFFVASSMIGEVLGGRSISLGNNSPESSNSVRPSLGNSASIEGKKNPTPDKKRFTRRDLPPVARPTSNVNRYEFPS